MDKRRREIVNDILEKGYSPSRAARLTNLVGTNDSDWDISPFDYGEEPKQDY